MPVPCDMRKSHVTLTAVPEPLIFLSDFKIIWHKRPRFIAVFNCFIFSRMQKFRGRYEDKQ